MSNFLPTPVLTCLDRVIEESAEVIHAACKVIRFGPDVGQEYYGGLSNKEHLFMEITQLEARLSNLKESLFV